MDCYRERLEKHHLPTKKKKKIQMPTKQFCIPDTLAIKQVVKNDSFVMIIIDRF
jgi:hypothetical protein